MFWNKKNKERFDKVPDTSVIFDKDENNIKIPVFSTPVSFPEEDSISNFQETNSLLMPDEILLKTPNTEESIVFSEKEKEEKKEEKALIDHDNNIILKDLEEKNLKFKTENENFSKEIKNLKSINENLEIKINSLKEENVKLKQDLSNLKSNEKLINSSELDRAKVLNEKYELLSRTHEELKAKIRHDIRKIRMREKELSNRIELIKQDRDTLLASKDQKILKLNKQIDDIEFQKEALNEINTKLKNEAKEYFEKTQRVIKALRLSTSLLESDEK